MRKPWVYKRKKIKAWWVGWYESGKRQATAFPNKNLAEHISRMKYAQLNSDVFTGTVNSDWHELTLIEEYQYAKRVAELEVSSLYETVLTLMYDSHVREHAIPAGDIVAQIAEEGQSRPWRS